MSSKPRVVKDYDKLDVNIQEQMKLAYPFGFDQHLITFTNKDGKLVSALPFETEDRYYLVRMTVNEAREIIEEDDDYDDEGNLKDEVKIEYEEKHLDMEDEAFDEEEEDEEEFPEEEDEMDEEEED